jgi:hypothetical protein
VAFSGLKTAKETALFADESVTYVLSTQAVSAGLGVEASWLEPSGSLQT